MRINPIPGFPGHHATEYGQIRREIAVGGKWIAGIATQRDDGRGYRCCDVMDANGKRRTMKVHRLVYAAFHGDIPKGQHIDHIDHDKTNNSIGNLRLRDASENSADCAKTPRAGARVLDRNQRRAVATLCMAGFGTKTIASLCGIGESTVRRVKKSANELLNNQDMEK